MRLTKLTVCGFKSFADKTDITFDAPIVCVVGPNGCGKSNIVDAIKWVLGEQSAKSLRGGAMMDVIFNGSSTRKPSGMASVTLSFENTDRKLPLDFDAVTVTRRLYRDGSSEYLLNNQRCRLRDVRELFMDTGVGTDAYSIIEQGKVDVLLQANPQQRREIFEEAAGISRFKARKHEATRKLERTENNLGLIRQRLEDTERRLRSVKAQASRARSYQEHSSKLRELQLTYTLEQYHKLRTELDNVRESLTQAATDRDAAARQLEEREGSLADAELERQAIAGQQKEVEHDRLTQQSVKEQAVQRMTFADSTIEDIHQQAEIDNGQRAQLARRIGELNAELDEQISQVQHLERSQKETGGRLEAAQVKHREAGHELNEKRSQLEDEKAGVVDLMRRSAQLHNEIQSIDVFEKGLVTTQEKLDQRTGQVSQELERLLCGRDDADAKHAEARSLLALQNKQLGEHAAAAAQLDSEQRAATNGLANLKEQRSALVSRQSLLQEMQDNQEGIADPVKAILAHKEAGGGDVNGEDDADGGAFQFVRALVAQIVETDPDQPDHARVVEAALGNSQQALLVDRLADVCLADQDGVGGAMGSLAGRVTFLPIDQFSSGGVDSQLSLDGSNAQRVIDLAQFPDWAAPVVDRLLGRTLVVDDLEAAAVMRERLPSGWRFVTRGGELLEADGRVVAGPLGVGHDEAGGGLISRRSELSRVARQIEELNRRIAGDEQQLTELGDRAVHVERVSEELRQSIYGANSDRIELESRLENLNGQIAQLEREQPVLAAETEQIHRQLREADAKRKTHEDEAKKLDADSSARREQVAGLESQIAELTQAIEASHEAVAMIRVEAGQVIEQLGAARRQVRQLEIVRDDVSRQHKALEDRLVERENRIEELKQSRFEAQKQVEQSDVRLQELEVREDLMRHRKEKADAAYKELRADVSQQRQVLEAAEKQAHRLDVTHRELQVKTETIVQRGQEQLSLELEEAYRGYEPQEIDWPVVEGQIKELRGKIDRLGTVNLDAINEQDELESTREDLGQQVEDIESAKGQLQRLIRQINDDSRKRFEEMFEQLRENFAGRDGLFRRLFGGGRADLILVPDEEGKVDVLESGIDIIAKPPGKEPQSISLLSGGEKTMTAVALLMSIFKAKPSPFCVLDEVDAALDEANLERFSQVVHSFLDQSHFIIITHQKRTMQVADLMYGITMQERGVSKRVSVRFEQVGHDGRISDNALANKVDEIQQPTPESDAVVEPLSDGVESTELETVGVAISTDDATLEESSGDRASVRSRLAGMLDEKDVVAVRGDVDSN